VVHGKPGSSHAQDRNLKEPSGLKGLYPRHDEMLEAQVEGFAPGAALQALYPSTHVFWAVSVILASSTTGAAFAGIIQTARQRATAM